MKNIYTYTHKNKRCVAWRTKAPRASAQDHVISMRLALSKTKASTLLALMKNHNLNSFCETYKYKYIYTSPKNG
ncbi:hypothetical protein HanRHA438_Chr16g0757031 [Helianthus annuus]|nr:hypothetical protein HanRHA438_Chr16g0757031 [Helianthus annuus]